MKSFGVIHHSSGIGDLNYRICDSNSIVSSFHKLKFNGGMNEQDFSDN